MDWGRKARPDSHTSRAAELSKDDDDDGDDDGVDAATVNTDDESSASISQADQCPTMLNAYGQPLYTQPSNTAASTQLSVTSSEHDTVMSAIQPMKPAYCMMSESKEEDSEMMKVLRHGVVSSSTASSTLNE